MDSGVLSGEETFTQPSSPWGESAVSGREGFSSCAHAAQGPRLASRVPQRRRALSLSLARGEERRKLPVSQGEEWKELKRSCEACAHRPLTQSPGLPETEAGSRSRLGTGPASPGGRERALRAIFGPNRHAPQIQAGGAGLEDRDRDRDRDRERKEQGQAKGVGVARGNLGA